LFQSGSFKRIKIKLTLRRRLKEYILTKVQTSVTRKRNDFINIIIAHRNNYQLYPEGTAILATNHIPSPLYVYFYNLHYLFALGNIVITFSICLGKLSPCLYFNRDDRRLVLRNLTWERVTNRAMVSR